MIVTKLPEIPEAVKRQQPSAKNTNRLRIDSNKSNIQGLKNVTTRSSQKRVLQPYLDECQMKRRGASNDSQHEMFQNSSAIMQSYRTSTKLSLSSAT